MFQEYYKVNTLVLQKLKAVQCLVHNPKVMLTLLVIRNLLKYLLQL